ncbi:response regulator [Swingsia samuiensis]|uniref:histidine kinase n=1 Tax=Swingsia samuiensis TaxID=1293412 RepID=A0A4Y6UIA4_9PROT|nr:response regulator [Swingsia samuiensis]QDH16388.1 response regulator [Swingsia samuiensis]
MTIVLNGIKHGRPKVLLVDDEEEILVALEDLLEDQYEIISTTDPLQALDLLKYHTDVATIISDQRMPALTGDQLLTRARKISDARSVLLTGYADLDAVVSALNQGQIQAYIHKPWDSETLRSLIAEVTQHSLAQRALRVEQALLRGLIDSLPLRLVFSDSNGRSIRNNCAHDCSGASEDELAYFPDVLRDEVTRMRDVVKKNGHVESLVAETVSDEDGKTSQKWHELTRFSLAWPQDEVLEKRWHVTMDRDVTSRVLMENHLRQSDKLQSLGTLAGGIAHDFNNLLAAISGSLELLEDIAELDETAQALVKNAMDSAQRGATLTRRLLQFGRPKESQLGPVSLQKLLSELEALLLQSLKSSQKDKSAVECHLKLSSVDDNIPQVWSDADQLEMALLNLCINARDAMKKGGDLSISVRLVKQGQTDLPPECCTEYAVAIDVEDQGEGMPPDVISRVFDPFFTTKEVGKGTGLGLSSVYGFLKRSFGDIFVESTPGAGTRMTVVLAAIRDEVVRLSPPRAQSGPEKELANRNLNILIIDDDPSVRLVTQGFLQQEGHNVVAVGSLSDILKQEDQLKNGFDLAVLDIMMPDYDGPTCAAILKERMPSLKILFISGHTKIEIEDKNIPLLSKPFTKEQLSGAIGNLSL